MHLLRMRSIAFLLLAGCTFPTPRQQQRAYADSLRPAEVKPAIASLGPVRKLRVRAYADPGYRTQTPRWNARIEEQIRRATGILVEQFGIELEVESVRPWNRSGGNADRMQDALAGLRELDPGGGVDWVVGFAEPLSVFSASQEELGIACMFCRHFIVRGMFSAPESDAIDRALPLLSTEEREALGRERRVHKEVAVFLHEWAHTLGAFHERSPQWLLSPIYDTMQSAFSEGSARIIRIALSHRDLPASKETWAKEYRAEVERDAATAWDPATKTAVLAAAQQLLVEASHAQKALPAADAAVLQKAVALETAEDYGRAELALQPLVDRYPANDEIQDLSCALAEKRRARVEALVAACRRAARLPEAPAWILLATAHALLSSGGREEAMALLSRAEAKLGDEPGSFLYLAQLQFEAGACSAAERSAARAKGIKGAERVTEECARIRHFVGFPVETGALPADRESDYVSGALAAHRSIEARKLEQARAAADVLRQSFPETPAAGVIECRAASRGATLAAIKSACVAVAVQAPDAFYPQYSLGLVAGAERRWADADAALQRAIRLDDSAPQVWQSLAAVKQKIGDLVGFQDLQRRFQARFKAALRPALWPAGWKAR
jgi:tetratricopeptide (TPR) repeat protein